MKNASSQIIYQYWDRLRGDRASPERSEIEPGEIRAALADTFVLETGDGKSVFRLAGTRLVAMFGHELKGMAMEDLWADPLGKSEIERLLENVMSETACAVAGFVAETDDNERFHLEMILLPLRHRGKTHARILGAFSAVSPLVRTGFQPIKQLRMVSVRMIWPKSRFASLANAAARRAGFIVHEGGSHTGL